MQSNNHFSQELCRHLSSLVPGFEGHYEYVPYLIAGTVEDLLRYEVRCKNEPREVLPSPYYDDVKAFPAWQVEDAIREMKTICDKSGVDWECLSCGHKEKYEFDCTCDLDQAEVVHGSYPIIQRIACMLMVEGDTAYQKIEEYLWSVLK